MMNCSLCNREALARARIVNSELFSTFGRKQAASQQCKINRDLFCIVFDLHYLCRQICKLMSKITNIVWQFIGRFKYHIVVVLGVLIVGFVDENSFVQRIRYDYQIEELKEEVAKYNKRYETDTRYLKNLNRDPKAIAKIARERYFMKADDEDIFVLSDDVQKPSADKKNEGAE